MFIWIHHKKANVIKNDCNTNYIEDEQLANLKTEFGGIVNICVRRKLRLSK